MISTCIRLLVGLLLSLTQYSCTTSEAEPVAASVASPAARQIVTDTAELSTTLDWAYKVAWSPDSQYFAVIGMKGSGDLTTYSVQVFDASTHKVIQEFPIKRPGSLLGNIAFSPDGKYLAAGTGVITLWDAKTWQMLRKIEGPYERGFAGGGVRSLTFSPDSKSLAVLYESVSWPETVVIRTREEAGVWAKKEQAAKKDGTFWEKLTKEEILSHRPTIMAFDVETNQRIFVQTAKPPTRDRERSEQFADILTYTEDGRYLLTSRVERPVYGKLPLDGHDRYFTFLEYRDPHTGRTVKEISDLHVMQPTAVAVSPNGKFVATGTNTLSKESTLNPHTKKFDLIDNKDPVKLWNLASGDKVMEYGPLRGAVRSLAFSPDSKLLVSCQTDLEKKETVWLWDVASGQLLERVRTSRSGNEFFGCAMSPNGGTVAMPVVGKIYLISLSHKGVAKVVH